MTELGFHFPCSCTGLPIDGAVYIKHSVRETIALVVLMQKRYEKGKEGQIISSVSMSTKIG